MPKIEYIPKKFVSWQEDLIDHVNNIVTTYKAQGYDLTDRWDDVVEFLNGLEE